MWNLKHEIISQNFYGLLIKTELKGDTDLDLKNFYNHIKMCINAVNRLREDLLHDYQSIKRHSEFQEYFFLDLSQPSYFWNGQTYNSLGHPLLVYQKNGTCVKSSMEHHTYKVFNTHAHEICGWKILLRLIHARTNNLGGMNGDV